MSEDACSIFKRVEFLESKCLEEAVIDVRFKAVRCDYRQAGTQDACIQTGTVRGRGRCGGYMRRIDQKQTLMKQVIGSAGERAATVTSALRRRSNLP